MPRNLKKAYKKSYPLVRGVEKGLGALFGQEPDTRGMTAARERELDALTSQLGDEMTRQWVRPSERGSHVRQLSQLYGLDPQNRPFREPGIQQTRLQEPTPAEKTRNLEAARRYREGAEARHVVSPDIPPMSDEGLHQAVFNIMSGAQFEAPQGKKAIKRMIPFSSMPAAFQEQVEAEIGRVGGWLPYGWDPRTLGKTERALLNRLALEGQAEQRPRGGSVR
jgi:hypothetical protein